MFLRLLVKKLNKTRKNTNLIPIVEKVTNSLTAGKHKIFFFLFYKILKLEFFGLKEHVSGLSVAVWSHM